MVAGCIGKSDVEKDWKSGANSLWYSGKRIFHRKAAKKREDKKRNQFNSSLRFLGVLCVLRGEMISGLHGRAGAK
jgi:hypothetical protein